MYRYDDYARPITARLDLPLGINAKSILAEQLNRGAYNVKTGAWHMCDIATRHRLLFHIHFIIT